MEQLSLQISADDRRAPVAKLKQRVQDKVGWPLESFILRSSRYVLEDARRLSDYCLADGDTLQVSVRWSGSKPSDDAAADTTPSTETMCAWVEALLDPATGYSMPVESAGLEDSDDPDDSARTAAALRIGKHLRTRLGLHKRVPNWRRNPGQFLLSHDLSAADTKALLDAISQPLFRAVDSWYTSPLPGRSLLAMEPQQTAAVRLALRIVSRCCAALRDESSGSINPAGAHACLWASIALAAAMPRRREGMTFENVQFTKLQLDAAELARTLIDAHRVPVVEAACTELTHLFGRMIHLGPDLLHAEHLPLLQQRLSLLCYCMKKNPLVAAEVRREDMPRLSLTIMRALDGQLLRRRGERLVRAVNKRLSLLTMLVNVLSSLISDSRDTVIRLHSLGWYAYLAKSTLLGCGFDTQLYARMFGKARKKIVELLLASVVGWEVLCADLRATPGLEHALLCMTLGEGGRASRELLNILSPHLTTDPEKSRRLLNLLPTFRFDPCPRKAAPSEVVMPAVAVTPRDTEASDDVGAGAGSTSVVEAAEGVAESKGSDAAVPAASDGDVHGSEPDSEPGDTAAASTSEAGAPAAAEAGVPAAAEAEEEASAGAGAEPPELGLRSLHCAVCTFSADAGEEMRILPCHHVFHRACIDQWVTFSLEATGALKPCPMCMRPINFDKLASAESGGSKLMRVWARDSVRGIHADAVQPGLQLSAKKWTGRELREVLQAAP